MDQRLPGAAAGSEGNGTIVSEIIIVFIYLSKPIEGITPGVTPNINYGDSGDNEACRFIVPNQSTLRGGCR